MVNSAREARMRNCLACRRTTSRRHPRIRARGQATGSGSSRILARNAPAPARPRTRRCNPCSRAALRLLRAGSRACVQSAILVAWITRTRCRPKSGPLNPPLLSPEDVAASCGLSRKAVYRAIERGELRAFRLCSRLRICAEDLEAWLVANQGSFAPSADPTAARAPFLDRSPAPGGLRRLLPSP